MYLISQNPVNAHVSHDTVKEFEKVIFQTDEVCILEHYSLFRYKLVYLFIRIFRKVKINIIPSVCRSYKDKPWEDSKHMFTIMMALDEMKIRPFILNSLHNKSIYLFDAWPKDYERIQEFCKNYRINYLFVTASQSSRKLQTLLPDTQIYWLPEGIAPQCYHSEDYSNKTIDVLALGRKYDTYHLLIECSLEVKGYTYLYEHQKGQLVFPTQEEFIQGLARTKISICVPSSVTHPQRSGDVETMTIRYLQSIVSKCILLGHAPKEMIELFGYNPVIEIDMENPVEQLDEILKNYSDYIPLIEKNYQIVLKYHTWKDRWNQIKECLIVNSKN
jgi:hypothetical protein